jgi:hypothetical protein
MARVESEVQTGKAARDGAAVQNAGDQVGPQPASVMPDNSQFLQANFAAVVGGATGGSSKHAGAPDGGAGGGSIPGGQPLLGHKDVGADAAMARGNAPQRSKPKPRPQNERPGAGD